MMPGWNTGMGMDFGMELESAISSASIYPAPSGVANGLYGIPPAETLHIDDLLDFSNFDLLPSGAPSTDTHILPPPPGYSTAYAGDSSGQQTGRSFTDELYIPCEEAAELEWLSNFVDDSFSEIPYSMSAIAAGTVAFSNLQVDPAGARGARSKRSRAPGAAASNQTATTWSSSSSSSSSSSEFPSQRPGKGGGRVKGARGEAEMETGGGIRRCTHCASDKTPQWRTGPMGPKTLCNACGVRYKSGRLVPEYRPAASPTFVLTQHSNSHRKVMELRRQKEHVSSSSVRPDMLFRDYEVC